MECSSNNAIPLFDLADTDSDTQLPTDSDSDSQIQWDTATDTSDTTPNRIVAIGNLHGDFNATLSALRTAAVIDDSNEWSGEETIVVQTGDILDYGIEERTVLEYLLALRDQARASGGDLVLLNGNHELMTMEGRYSYLDTDACVEYVDLPGLDTGQDALGDLDSIDCKTRGAAFLPGGPYALKISEFPVTAIVGDTLFVHGGVLMSHLEDGLDFINLEVARFARGETPTLNEDAYDMVWDRTYSDNDVESLPVETCQSLDTVLSILSLSTMVVAHSRFDHINSDCNGAVWRIDTGLSSYFGGPIEVLEIKGDAFTVLQSIE